MMHCTQEEHLDFAWMVDVLIELPDRNLQKTFACHNTDIMRDRLKRLRELHKQLAQEEGTIPLHAEAYDHAWNRER